MNRPPRDSEIRDQLLAEHAGVRSLLHACVAEARAVLAFEGDPRRLLARVVQLLETLREHNRSEEAVLRPLLLEGDSSGVDRVDQMEAEHIVEHAWLRQALREAANLEVPDRAAHAILEAARLIEHHIDREEARFLNDRVLRDDLIPIGTLTD